ncbi:MAG: DUF5996 family protein [Acidobacteriota bacterium]
MTTDLWPPLPLEEWEDTRDTLHMWTQIVGKIRMVETPKLNHWWNVTLYVTPRGLTTSAMPWGSESFSIDFDFIDHQLVITTSTGDIRSLPFFPRPVAELYRELMSTLAAIGIHPKFSTLPSELDNPIRFENDTTHAAYDGPAVHRFWRALLQIDRVMQEFRARFRGKCSPVHFFWGGFDHAVTRFSGRPAPPHPEWGPIEREAYSDECHSVGFWPGGGKFREAMFFGYVAPEPPGFAEGAPFYNREASLCLLPYTAVRASADPDAMLLDFFQSTYDAAGWDAGTK